jgi:Zn-dependent protease
MDFSTEAFIRLAAWIGPLIIAITFHEVAHGWVALKFGDTTARDLGRLSLNPLRHVDPIGTVVLPGILALSGAPVFGWAKPVPVYRERLRSPIRDMALVALAGPATNIILAIISALLLTIMLLIFGQGTSPFVLTMLMGSIFVNCSLAVFNMLPIPPFDGSRVVRPLFTGEWGRKWDNLDRYGIIVLLVLIVGVPMLFNVNPIAQTIGPVIMGLVNHILDGVVAISGVDA